MKKISVILLAVLAIVSCSNATAHPTQSHSNSHSEPASKSAKAKELSSTSDSINFCLGFVNGYQIKSYYLANDSSQDAINEFVHAIERGYAGQKDSLTNAINPQLVSMGEQIGQSIKEQEPNGLLGITKIPTKFNLIKQGFISGLHQDQSRFTVETASTYLQNTISKIQYGDTKAEGEKFLAENARHEGVVTTPSGLQYEVINLGHGAKPSATDKVKVHYEGRLIDGTVFDSSYQRGEPITFGLNQVIKGWTEGVQLMPVGSKFRFYIPYDLGYGANGAGGSIPPYAALIFDVELISIEK